MNPLEFEMGSLLDALADGICVSDGEGRVLYMNPAAQRLLETTLPVVQSRNFCELLCGRLETTDGREHASSCLLLDPRSALQAVAFEGVHNRRTAFAWHAEDFTRVKKGRHLRVRCLRASVKDAPAGAHVTIIEDVSADLELKRRREERRTLVAEDIRRALAEVLAAVRKIKADAARTKKVEECARACRRIGALLEAAVLFTPRAPGPIREKPSSPD